jgi:hypothetical protein
MDVMNGGKIQSMTVNHLLAINRISTKPQTIHSFLQVSEFQVIGSDEYRQSMTVNHQLAINRKHH